MSRSCVRIVVRAPESGELAKLVDAPGLGPDARNSVRVRVSHSPPLHNSNMFKYTPKKEIAADLNRALTLQYPKNHNEWDRIMQIHRVSEYHDRVQFQLHYLNTVFFSPAERSYVPVGSSVFPMWLFDVEIV